MARFYPSLYLQIQISTKRYDIICCSLEKTKGSRWKEKGWEAAKNGRIETFEIYKEERNNAKTRKTEENNWKWWNGNQVICALFPWLLLLEPGDESFEEEDVESLLTSNNAIPAAMIPS